MLCSKTLQGVKIVVNLEDDVRVADNFVSKIMRFRRSLKKYEARHFTNFPAFSTDVCTYFFVSHDWISFLTSKYLSVGRVYNV